MATASEMVKKRAIAREMRAAGKTFREIGEHLGLTREGARQLLLPVKTRTVSGCRGRKRRLSPRFCPGCRESFQPRKATTIYCSTACRSPDLTGREFGLWLVLGAAATDDKRGARGAHWLCRCRCGAESVVAGYKLLGGGSRRCRACCVGPTYDVICLACGKGYVGYVGAAAKRTCRQMCPDCYGKT